MNKYTVSESTGISYDHRTPRAVINALDRAFKENIRIKIYYGDTETGRDWNEENDVTGTVGCSTGPNKIPLMINNARSMGGPGMLDHCIVKIKAIQSGIVMYQHPKYQAPVVDIVPSDMEGYACNTLINGKLHGRHKTFRSAVICKNKIA